MIVQSYKIMSNNEQIQLLTKRVTLLEKDISELKEIIKNVSEPKLTKSTKSTKSTKLTKSTNETNSINPINSINSTNSTNSTNLATPTNKQVIKSQKKQEKIEFKQNVPKFGTAWTNEEHEKLLSEIKANESIEQIALKHQRTKGGIENRLRKHIQLCRENGKSDENIARELGKDLLFVMQYI